MATVEKHGALWLDDPADSRTQPLFERFDAESGLLAIVVRTSSGHFIALVYEKSADPQWRLPWWSQHGPQALFANLEEAIQHSLVLQNPRIPLDADGERKVTSWQS